MVAGSTNLKLAAWTVGGSLLLALVGGLLAFGGLTRRLRALAANVAAFRRDELGGGAGAVSAEGRGDEISRLARAFHEMAERIRRQIEELKETDRLRRELVANVSHDLRTPLTHLQGYLETLQLKEDALPAEERREYLAIAAQQSERLGRLVDDLFELAKLDASQDLPDREVFAVSELVQDVAQKFRLPAMQKGVALEADIAGGPGPVSADLGLIERVLENLVENALRYTPDGGRVTVSVRPRSEGVLLEVSDTGAGIPASQLPHIFDRFHRYAPPGGRGAGGAGLGLAIARRALELHGSDLGCDSAPGSGTTFRFLLPAPPA
jgi:signal transduction histidine kinase